MRVVFLGPPGAGKGTQAARLSEKTNVPHISTGDILRRAIQFATPTGVQAKEFVDSGALVPFPIVLRLVRDRLQEKDTASGWILDGFPRNLEQADAFAEILAEIGSSLDRVLYLDVADDELVRRLSGRRVCRECGATYHVDFSPTQAAGKCDACEGEIYQRTDDGEEAIRHRLEVYRSETEPLVSHYRERGALATLDGSLGIDEVTSAMWRELDEA